MYTLIIIDDEYEQVRGIKDFIDWAKHDIEVSGVAYNGRDGLSLFQEQSPDIAIVDIQMPYMDGLTLIEEVNRTARDTEIIILSGHDNFEYARKAIHLQANNYLLKPCSAEEILQAVLRAKNLVADKRDKKDILQSYHALFQEYKVLLKEKMILDLLHDKLRNPATFYQDAMQYGIDLTQAPCCVCIFRLIDIDSLYAHHTNEEFDYFMLSITSLIGKHMETMGHSEIIVIQDDMVLITTGMDSSAFTSSVRVIHQDLSHAFAYDFAAGVGSSVPTPLSASASYHQALAALESSIFLGADSVTVFGSHMLEGNYQYFYPFRNEEKIFSAIESGDQGLTEALVTDFFDAFDPSLRCDHGFTKKIGITLQNSIYKYCADHSIDAPEIDRLIYQNFDEIISAKTFDILKQKIIAVLNSIIELITRDNQLNQLIQNAVEYIHAHYSENINLTTVADTLYITPAYLSVLFKQETKKNFIDYLNNYRLDRAKELLKDIRLKNYEIAYQTGFQDEKYFYKLFKKHTGLTPSQYRDSLLPIVNHS